MLRTLAVALVFAGSSWAAPGGFIRAARANPAGVVPTAGYPGTGRQVHAEVDYSYEIDRALITREATGDPNANPLGPLPRQREFEFHQYRHVMTPKLDIGVYHDLWVSLEAPIVLAQARQLDVASDATLAELSTVTDGLLPATGYDARNPSVPPGGEPAFRGVNRRGVESLHLGAGYAPMNQALDDTRPTWKLGAELQLTVSHAMRFDAVNPALETGVASGTDELRLWTSIDRRYHYFESWFEAYWQVPLFTRASGLFTDPGFGADHVAPGQRAGAAFGVEAYGFEDAASGNRVSVDLGARLTAHFEGRGYSEMWELFARAGDRRTAGPLELDGDPTMPGTQALSHPGITDIENYLQTAARLAVRASLGPRWRFALHGELSWTTDHVISFADAGNDLPTCPTGAPRCEIANNSTVDPGTAEVNPLQVKLIDLVGHRYHSENGFGVTLGLEVQALF